MPGRGRIQGKCMAQRDSQNSRGALGDRRMPDGIQMVGGVCEKWRTCPGDHQERGLRAGALAP